MPDGLMALAFTPPVLRPGHAHSRLVLQRTTLGLPWRPQGRVATPDAGALCATRRHARMKTDTPWCITTHRWRRAGTRGRVLAVLVLAVAIVAACGPTGVRRSPGSTPAVGSAAARSRAHPAGKPRQWHLVPLPVSGRAAQGRALISQLHLAPGPDGSILFSGSPTRSSQTPARCTCCPRPPAAIAAA